MLNIKLIMLLIILISIITIMVWAFAIKEYGIATGQIETLLALFGIIFYNKQQKE